MAGLDIAPIVRTQDFSIIKQNEDSKAALDQGHIAVTRERQETNRSQDVTNTTNTEWYNKDPDAREKGSNSYFGDGGNERRNASEKKKPVDRVVVKGNVGGFDLKI